MLTLNSVTNSHCLSLVVDLMIKLVSQFDTITVFMFIVFVVHFIIIVTYFVAVLLYLLRSVIPPNQQSVVFVATKHHVEYLKEILSNAGIDSSYVYGSLDQTGRRGGGERERELEGRERG